VSKTDFSGVF